VSIGRGRDIRPVTEVFRPFSMTPQDSRFSWLVQGDVLCRTIRERVDHLGCLGALRIDLVM